MKRIVEPNHVTIKQEKIQWKQLMTKYCKASMIPAVLTRIIPATILVCCWLLFELLTLIIVSTRAILHWIKNRKKKVENRNGY